MKWTALLAQTDPRILEALQQIATAQIIMAAATAAVGLIVLGAAFFLLLEVRRARRMVHEQVMELKPKLAPLIDRAKSVTDDVASMTDVVRRRVDDTLHTLEEVRRTVERGSTATEERVRRFAAVLDVVQTEAEDILLDATATARGVHETARALQEPRPRARRVTAAPEPEEESA